MTQINKDALGKALNTLKMLANESRLSALCIMLENECSVNELAEELGMSQSALSQHLKILRDNGLVTVRRDHRNIYYKTSDPKLLKLIMMLKELYCDD